jgi:hypothetical protein
MTPAEFGRRSQEAIEAGGRGSTAEWATLLNEEVDMRPFGTVKKVANLTLDDLDLIDRLIQFGR